MDEYYTTHDIALLADTLTTNIAFLTISWRQMLGRPTIVLVATKNFLGNSILLKNPFGTHWKYKAANK